MYALHAEELNIKAHKKCKLRSGNDYKECYLYFSRIYPKGNRNRNSLSSNDRAQELIVDLQSYGMPSANNADTKFLQLHFKLMYIYWLEHAKKKGESFPAPILRLDNGVLKGCGGKSIYRYPNIYCADSGEITLNVKPLIKGFTDKKNLNLSYLSLAILSHEFGHHINHHIGREKYLKNEESEADWRSGKYFSYAMSNRLIPLSALTKSANLFFSVGDFHLLSKHENPQERFNAFMNGFNDEYMGIGSFAGKWLQDTSKTFSKRVHKSKDITDGKLYFDVYRFEIERAKQITGNIFAGIIGAVNCSQGSSKDCAQSLLIQGQAKPEGWFRERKMIIDCKNKIFDIKGDGFKAQQINSDRKGQAQSLSKRYCRKSGYSLF